jgi:hypothetical protein
MMKAGVSLGFRAEDGTALYKTPTGAIWHGTWKTINGDQLCADWKERPSNNCVQYSKDGDKITVTDAHSGELRATIVKTTPDNAKTSRPDTPDRMNLLSKMLNAASGRLLHAIRSARFRQLRKVDSNSPLRLP